MNIFELSWRLITLGLSAVPFIVWIYGLSVVWEGLNRKDIAYAIFMLLLTLVPLGLFLGLFGKAIF